MLSIFRHACEFQLPILAALLFLACDKVKGPKPSTDDTAPTHDTGPIDEPDPGCDTGYLDDDGECVPASCGTGTWGNLEVDESTVYVDVAAAKGGDGSEAAPFTSIQAGLDAAGDADGGMVAVAAGSYPETLEMDRGHDGVHLAGRCSELVFVDASGGTESSAGIEVEVRSSQVEVSGVTVSGSRYVGVRVGSGTMSIRDSAVVDNEFIGVAAYQAGIYATTLTMEACGVEGNTAVGVLAYDSGSSVTLRETAIEHTESDEKEEGGYGIEVYGGASLDAEGCELRENTGMGVAAYDSGTSVTLRETAIEDTKPDENGGDGYGIEVYGGASLDAEACEIRENTGAGVAAFDSGTSVTLRESAIEDTKPKQSGEGAFGIQVAEGASLIAEACEVRGNTGIGVAAFDPASSVSLRDTSIEDTKPDENGEGGYGIQVKKGASLDVEGCEVRENTNAGMLAYDSGTSVTLRETAIEDTQPDENGEGGFGIGVLVRASLDAEACEVRGNTALGVAAYDSDA